MQYVKSVYPKWSADLKRWQEARNRSQDPIARSDQKRTSLNPGSALHSTPRASRLSFERSPSHTPHIREDTGTKYGGSSGYLRDTNGSYMDKTRYDKDKMGYPKERASFLNGSLRDRSDLSWDEMVFRKGYSENDMRYPWGGTMVYPQHSPHGMYLHPAHSYVLPMPAYGMPRWSTPGYHDPWSMSYTRGTGYEDYGNNDRQNLSFERRRQSYEGHERPHKHETLQRDVLPNSENREFSSRFYAESSPDNGRYPARRYSNRKQDLLGSSVLKADTQQLRRGEEGASQDQSDGGISDDPEKIKRPAPRKETKDRISQHSDVHSERRMQQRNNPDQDGNFNEELTDHTTLKTGEFGEQHLTGGRDCFVERVEDARLKQLRSKENEFGSGEVINTDSISLPTIHQYEGDPGEIFSEISSSEPLNHDYSQQIESKHSKGGNLNSQQPSDRIKSKQGIKGNSDRDNSDGEQLKKDGTGLVGDDQAQEKDKEIDSNISQKNKVGTDGNDKQLLTTEVSESKTSVVEDLIGDDVSDFEVSNSEHSEVSFERNAPIALASGNVDGETGLVGHEIEDICNENVNGMKAKQTGVMIESMDECEYSGFPNDALVGKEETQTGIEDNVQENNIAGKKAITRNNLSNESTKQQKEVAGSVVAPLRNETEDLMEDEVPTETGKGKVNEQNAVGDSFTDENNMTHSGDEPIPEELQKTDGDVSTGKSKVAEDNHRDEKTNYANNSGKESVIAVLENEKKGENDDKESDGKFLSENEKSKSGLLEELSLSSVESSSESLPALGSNMRLSIFFHHCLP